MNPQIDKTKLPQHVAIIMDGNGRWAKARGLPRLEGHRRGAETVDDITEFARDIGIKFLTLYAFSKENWQRPADETRGLMTLLGEYLLSKKGKMIDNGIRLNAIGDLSQLPRSVHELVMNTIHETSAGCEMVLTLALSYGARDEIIRAIHHLGRDALERNAPVDHLTEAEFSRYLDTKGMPDPDLIIRTSGENRISNFLLWQSAYAELDFIDVNWPEFSREHFARCLLDYQRRERRFGLVSEHPGRAVHKES